MISPQTQGFYEFVSAIKINDTFQSIIKQDNYVSIQVCIEYCAQTTLGSFANTSQTFTMCSQKLYKNEFCIVGRVSFM